MQRVIDLVEKFSSDNEIAVGAIVVKDGEVISSAVNKKEELKDVTAHAEILALREAFSKLGRWRLDDCELYVTLEPCPMCAWAILQSRIKMIYFGSFDAKYGAFGSAMDLRNFSDWKPQVYGGILEKECDEILQKCFEKMRK